MAPTVLTLDDGPALRFTPAAENRGFWAWGVLDCLGQKSRGRAESQSTPENDGVLDSGLPET